MFGIFIPQFQLIKQVLVVTSVETPFTLFEEPVKIVLFDAVELAQMSLGLIPKILDAVDMILPPGKQLGMVDATMIKL